MDFLNFFEPVRIGTNINLLRRATILETYTNQSNTENEGGRVCSICQNNYINGDIVRKINHCHHFYHHMCLEQWLENNTKCPECQYDLRESRSINDSNNENNQTTIPSRLSNTNGIPPSFNHPFNNPNININTPTTANPYSQVSLQNRISEIIHDINQQHIMNNIRQNIINNIQNNHQQQIPNIITIPIFRNERENTQQNILNEINEIRNRLNNNILNSLSNSLHGRLPNSIINSNTSNSNINRTEASTHSENISSTNRTTTNASNIPHNIQQIIQHITNTFSSDDTENPSIEIEYYYHDNNSPTIQRIRQQIHRNTSRNTESDQETETESVIENERPPPSLEHDNSENDNDNNNDDDKQNKENKNKIQESLEFIISKINNFEKKIEEIDSKINIKENKEIKEIKEIKEFENENIKKTKCSLFSCWKK